MIARLCRVWVLSAILAFTLEFLASRLLELLVLY
jgi:hypothetical protein